MRNGSTDINAILQALDALDIQNSTIEDAKRLLKGNLLPASFQIFKKGHLCYRARRHASNRRFNHVRDLSYRLDSSSIGLGRANASGHSVFYGSVASQEIDEGRATATVETSRLFRNRLDGLETFTVGKWLVHEDFSLPLLVLSAEHGSHMTEARVGFEKQRELLETVFYKTKSGTTRLMERLALEFTREVPEGEPYQYLISAAFAELLYEKYDGFLYPSVQTKFQGLNFVLQPHAVDTRLKLEKVLVCQAEMKGGTMRIRNYEIGTVGDGGWINYGKLDSTEAEGIPFGESL